MSQGLQLPRLVKFEEYELDFVREELRKHGFVVKLQPQPFKILAYLATRPDVIAYLLSRDQFARPAGQVRQYLERLRLELDDKAMLAQLFSDKIKFVFFKLDEPWKLKPLRHG